jgi:hypothetical protein
MLPLPSLRSLTLALGGKLDEDEASWLKFTILWNWLQLGVVVSPLLVAPLVLVMCDQFLSTHHVGRFVVRECKSVSQEDGQSRKNGTNARGFEGMEEWHLVKECWGLYQLWTCGFISMPPSPRKHTPYGLFCTSS